MRDPAVPALLAATIPSCIERKDRRYYRRFFSLRRSALLKHLQSMAITTVSKEFFEEKYRASGDPWNFSTSAYELNRYDEVMRLLGNRIFNHAFEPGCSIGVLTERLAGSCRRLRAMDISPTAVAMARQRCERYPNVTIAEGALPDDLPHDTFDLIIFSEIGYYFERGALAALRDSMVECLANQGLLVALHWLGISPDHLLTGDEVHDVLRSTKSLRMAASRRYVGFLLESWERT
jgi:SAM-dependent methyltransferase